MWLKFSGFRKFILFIPFQRFFFPILLTSLGIIINIRNILIKDYPPKLEKVHRSTHILKQVQVSYLAVKRSVVTLPLEFLVRLIEN